MTAEIVKFDPGSYVEKLREKVKAALVDVVPDEQWDAMIKGEIDGFFKDKEVREYGSARTIPSAFKQVAERLIRDEAEKMVKDMLQAPEWQGYWVGQKMVAGASVQAFLKEHSGEIIERWIGGAIQQVISTLAFVRTT